MQFITRVELLKMVRLITFLNTKKSKIHVRYWIQLLYMHFSCVQE